MAALVANSPSVVTASAVRRPRGFVRINGARTSCLGFDADLKKTFGSDTFTVDLEPWNQPEGRGLVWWDKQTAPVKIELLMGYLGPADDVAAWPANPTSLTLGQADSFDCDPLTGKLVIHGRDLSQAMIDTKFSNLWPDATSSSIAQTIADGHGFGAQITGTSTPAGQYAGGAYGSVALGMPEWDVLTRLAQQEGFDCYMQGNTLYFGPPQNDTGPYVLNLTRDASGRLTANSDHEVNFHRDLTRARPINVSVLSHNVADNQTLTATATQDGDGEPQNYQVRRPNLSSAQAQQLADGMMSDILFHERKVDASLAGDPSMSPRRQLRVTGTGTGFDQLYALTSVKHRWSAKKGYSMRLEAGKPPKKTKAA